MSIISPSYSINSFRNFSIPGWPQVQQKLHRAGGEVIWDEKETERVNLAQREQTYNHDNKKSA